GSAGTETSEAEPGLAGTAADSPSARRPSVFEPWSAETGWPETGVADGGAPEPDESGTALAGPDVDSSGGSRASLFERRSTDGPGPGADGFDGQGDTGLDVSPWADGDAAGFAQPGWPAGAEPDSPVA